jgi:hypothetical protein
MDSHVRLTLYSPDGTVCEIGWRSGCIIAKALFERCTEVESSPALNAICAGDGVGS